MKNLRCILLALATAATPGLRAGELTPEVEAKFLKVIISSSGNTKIGCNDSALKTALEAQGITIDSSSSIVWVTSAAEAKAYKAMGRLVIVSKRDLASVASVVLDEEGGRPKLLLNTANLHQSKVQLGDAVLKIAEKI